MITLGTENKTQLINLAIEIIQEGQQILNKAIQQEFIDFDFHEKKLNQIANIFKETKNDKNRTNLQKR